MMDENWNVLKSFFPDNWQEAATITNALKGLRKDKSAEMLLRTLLIHIACGYSLRETVVRAKKAKLAAISDVALLKRLRKSKDWLYMLCASLFQERGFQVSTHSDLQFRLFDATTVKEPGKTGSLWRVHYSFLVPSMSCDFFKVTATKGIGTGEDFRRFPIDTGDFIIADRGYCRATGIEHIATHDAFVCVRVNTQTLPLRDKEGNAFPLEIRLKDTSVTDGIACWSVTVPTSSGDVPGRLCALRKSEEAIRIAHKKLRRKASKIGQKLKDETLFFAEYVIVFTTFPENIFSVEEVLEWYRIRWQVELVFKRFKQIARLGHLPKYDDESAKAWLYGKLLAALLTEKIIAHAATISPWGYYIKANK